MEVQELRDRESIRRTLARYTLHGDRGRVDELVACFATDGVLEFENEWTARGHDGIREHVSTSSDLTAARSTGAILLRHHVSTQGIEFESNEDARVWSYFMAVTDGGPDHVGRYVDRMTRVGDDWLIRHRRIRVEWWSPRTIYVDEAARALAPVRGMERDRGVADVPASGAVRVEVRDRVGWITFDRPDVMNRFEGTMREELLAALRRFEANDDVRCIAITGAGRAFSAGADVDDMTALQRSGGVGADEIRRRVELGARIVRTIRGLSKPVVAVLDGVAAGAGMNLALACDLCVGSTRAGFSASFVRIGLVPDWGGIHFLTRRVGRGRAASLMMTGRRVGAEEAFALGLLDHLYPDASFEDDAKGLLDELSAAPQGALAEIKRGLALEEDLDAVLGFEAEVQPRLFLSDDCREGLSAFLEKRPPRFGG